MLAPTRALEGTALADELTENGTNGTRTAITWITKALEVMGTDQKEMARQLGEVHSGVAYLRADGKQYSRELGRLEGRVERMSKRVDDLERLRWKVIGAATALGGLTGGGAWLLFSQLLG